MFSLVAIATLSLGCAGLGWWCKKLLAKVSTLEYQNALLSSQTKVQKKQLDIAAGPALDADAILRRMRENGL